MKTTQAARKLIKEVIGGSQLAIRSLNLPIIASVLMLAMFVSPNLQADSLSSLSSIGDVLHEYSETQAQKEYAKYKARNKKSKDKNLRKARRVAGQGNADDFIKTVHKRIVKKNCVPVMTDYGKVIEDCIVSEEELDQISATGDKACKSMRSGKQYKEAKAHKVAIMGDGSLINEKGEIDFDDDRQACGENDLACKASGTIWCEDYLGDLVQAGSGTVVDGEMVYDSSSRKFNYVKFKALPGGQVRLLFAGHSKIDKRKKFNKQKNIEFPGSCYFYPKGNEPRNVIHGNQETFESENFRKNENELRAKIQSSSNDLKPGQRFDDGEYNVGVLDKDITKLKVPILNVPRELLQELADKGAKIKQYGYNKDSKTVDVAKRNNKLFALKNPSYVNNESHHTVLDCNDTNGGASGGASTIDVMDAKNRRFEAVYAVRAGSLTRNGYDLDGPGDICDPTLYANIARLVSGKFYKQVKTPR